MGQTMSEKILSNACRRVVSVGELVWPRVDIASIPDRFEFEYMKRHALRPWNPEQVMFSFDHFISGAVHLPKVRRWADAHGVPKRNVYDVGRHGNSHQIGPEEGWVLPGRVIASADTQASTAGALNCFAIACLVEGIEYVMATGDMWVKVPECVRIVLHGSLRRGLTGKDVYIGMLNDLRGVIEGRVIEFTGPGVASLSIDQRMAIANGAPHLGAATMIFPPDERLFEYVRPRAKAAFTAVQADPDARYVESREYQLNAFEPLITGPGNLSQMQRISAVAGTKVQAAFIGSCSSGRYEDLALAAEVLKGRHISADTRLVVTPLSSKIMQQAAEDGIVTTLVQAGATVTAPGCGACFHGNQSPLQLDDSEVCISASVENYAGRMGSAKAMIYLANAAVVAASALEGSIADPSRYLSHPAQAAPQ
jgi:3-isopropylmalate/(R)-2-methylmalate dehydratase large subunit